MSLLITGSKGFVGQALTANLLSNGISVRLTVRKKQDQPDEVVVGNIDANTNWSASLIGVDAIIHCAARAHVMNVTDPTTLAAYRSVNVDGTRNLAEQAVAAGVRRLIYLSSIKVNGEQTDLGSPYLYSDTELPEDFYGTSKWEAEQVLNEDAIKTGLEVVIIRPPLVYGPKVKGNFLRLLQLIDKGVPLPLGLVSNARSLVGLDNLVDLVLRCVDHPMAAGKKFLVSDGEDLSTPNLIRRIAKMMGKSPRLLPIPVSIMRMTGRLTNKLDEVDRLVGSLQVVSQYTREVLDWVPPVSLNDGLQRTVDWYMEQG